MIFPPVIVVDENDNEIDTAMLAEVWERGLYHRVVRIMVEDADGRILLQRRSKNMILYPGYWETSAAGLVDQGMSYLDAARQEVTEELGIDDPELHEAGRFFMRRKYEGRTMNNFNKLYTLRLRHQAIRIEEEEVAEICWFDRDGLRSFVANHPDEVTPALAYVVEHYFQELYTGVQ